MPPQSKASSDHELITFRGTGSKKRDDYWPNVGVAERIDRRILVDVLFGQCLFGIRQRSGPQQVFGGLRYIPATWHISCIAIGGPSRPKNIACYFFGRKHIGLGHNGSLSIRLRARSQCRVAQLDPSNQFDVRRPSGITWNHPIVFRSDCRGASVEASIHRQHNLHDHHDCYCFFGLKSVSGSMRGHPFVQLHVDLRNVLFSWGLLRGMVHGGDKG